MTTYRIALVPGDNVGPEVVSRAREVIECAASATAVGFVFDTFPWGAGYFLEHGRAAPEGHVDVLRAYDAILLGAHGDPARVPDRIGSQQLMHPIRKGLDLYVNYRPARLTAGVPSPLASPGEIDLVVVRENTEGEYSNVGGSVHAGGEHEVAMQTTVVTRFGAERVIRYAFELSMQRRKKVHCVTKSNALAHVMELWDSVFMQVASEFPDVETTKSHVDAMSMYLVTRPSSFDVIVATNLMGDIVSDEAAAVTGGIGLAASANLNPARTGPSMFEPVHGSAPDIAGLGVANPIAAIGAGAMMLGWLGEQAMADAINSAVESVLRGGRVRTRDLGGTATTAEMTDAVMKALTSAGSAKRRAADV